MRVAGFLFLLNFLAFSHFVSASNFSDNELSGKKESFCNAMVKRFGYESAEKNNSLPPRANNWKTDSIDEAGWFSSKLYIRKEQTTSDGFNHRATCEWDDVGGFTLFLYVRNYGNAVIYYDY